MPLAPLSRVLALGAALLCADAVAAATITVDTLDDELNADGDCSLREAVEAADTDVAVDGCVAGENGTDEIVFDASLANGEIVLATELVVNRRMTIGGGADGVVVAGAGEDRLFTVDGGTLTLLGLTLREGKTSSGGAVFVRDGGALVAEGGAFVDNVAANSQAAGGGGAVFVLSGSATFRDTAFRGNGATRGYARGGAIRLEPGSEATCIRCTFVRNRSNGGGAIYNGGGALVLVRTDFDENEGDGRDASGGAVAVGGGGTATVDRGTFTANTGTTGGAVWVGGGSTLDVDGAVFDANSSSREGGAVYVEAGAEATLVGVTATGNVAIREGGAMYSLGRLAVVSGQISGNQASSGGGVGTFLDATTVLVETTITGNTATNVGGGLWDSRGRAVVIGGLVADNTAGSGGGLAFGGAFVVSGSRGDIPDDLAPGVPLPEATEPRIQNNVATATDMPDAGGGGLSIGAVAEGTISDARISGNTASTAGGGLRSFGRLTVFRGQISGNTAGTLGGGVYVDERRTDLVDVRVSGNDAGTAPGLGGGVHAAAGTVLIVRGGTINSNAAVEGGGIWTAGALSMNAGASGDRDTDAAATEGDRSAFTTITGNRASGATAGDGGGGIYVEAGGSADLRYATISSNTAVGVQGSGGGLLVADGGTAALAFSEITGNTANRAGGGVELFDDAGTVAATTLTLRAVEVSTNTISVAAPGNGGGVHIGGAGSADLSQSLVAGNRAAEGGGLWLAAGASLAMGNATVSNNTAVGDGGGVYDDGGATIALESVTVAGNAAGLSGGGLRAAGAGVSIRNTIVGTNTAATGADCAGSVASGGFNLVATTAGCTLSGDTATNVTDVDPNIRGLQPNGGFTRTHAPRPASPAVDAGDSAFAVDQRGLPRQDPDDIGALDVAATVVALGEDPVAGAFGLATPAPNPASGRATVAFSVAAPGRVELALFDALGRRVQTVFDGEVVPGGVESAPIDVSGLAAGVYIVRLSGAAGVATRTLTVVR
ncbi:choice-of-anchor Q domain-containing protein [Rubrivirga sp. IMCC45206]|uniref:choice-of-anchor Q domain-containing protein n=1 Tax=Rubrivirga sp. IMCC45206 TaxID=3391614 RepID=UPI00398FF34C